MQPKAIAKQTHSDPDPEPDLDTEPLLGSGFEEEQPEPDFDERI
jgi:hypothetical protein